MPSPRPRLKIRQIREVAPTTLKTRRLIRYNHNNLHMSALSFKTRQIFYSFTYYESTFLLIMFIQNRKKKFI